jgi:hypothetical protein
MTSPTLRLKLAGRGGRPVGKGFRLIAGAPALAPQLKRGTFRRPNP